VKRVLRRSTCSVALATILLPSVAFGWWNDDWDYRKQIRFDLTPNGADVSGTITEMPMLVRLSIGNFSFFGDAQPDGSDIRFVAPDDVTPLSFYIEKFDAVNQLALIWVKVPELTGGSSTESVFMYYGNPEADSASDGRAVFRDDTRLALSFEESDGAFRDLSAYGNDPIDVGAEFLEAGLIGGAAAFTPGSAGIRLPPVPGLAIIPDAGFTLQLWARPPDDGGDGVIAKLDDPQGGSVELGHRQGAYYVNFGGAVEPIVLEAQAPQDADWTHIGLRVDGSGAALFLNGLETAAAEIDAVPIAGGWTLGERFAGALDQVTVHSSALETAWLKLSARNEAPFSTVTYYGEDAQREGAEGGESYIAVTLRNVTVDGWVVIVILAVMAIVSWVVMALKTVLLRRIERQNSRFLRQYSRLTGDPLALDKDVPELNSHAEETLVSSSLEDPESYHPSTLFPIYHAGALEVKKRLELRSPAAGAQASGFTAETIGAISASIDAALVRQRQKLNKLMVLLTIAISGGPFLGLLGTVVGVMITFAAIAAQGDVNVNAIAPGIAAALVATVAGLVVAIPALFGYNYLGSRIKDIDANSQVFADEFVNKIAEHYV